MVSVMSIQLVLVSEDECGSIVCRGAEGMCSKPVDGSGESDCRSPSVWEEWSSSWECKRNP